MEATHLIKPFSTSAPKLYDRQHSGIDSCFIQSTIAGGMVGRTSFCNSVDEAVAEWNSMFSKAPYVAHTGEVDMWPEKHNG